MRMPPFQPNDETIWGLAGARMAPPLPSAEGFVTKPILDLLRAGAARDPNAVALVSLNDSLRFWEMLRLAQNAACAIARIVPPGGAVACLLPRTPESIAASHVVGNQIVRTRPLCAYPNVARYSGSGSIDDAANFSCQKP